MVTVCRMTAASKGCPSNLAENTKTPMWDGTNGDGGSTVCVAVQKMKVEFKKIKNKRKTNGIGYLKRNESQPSKKKKRLLLIRTDTFLGREGFWVPGMHDQVETGMNPGV